MNATIEIDKSGRLVVPKKMRDAMHLRAGDRLEAELTDERLTLAPKRMGRGLYAENGWFVYDSGVPMSVEEAAHWVDDAREERIQMLVDRVMKP